VSNFPREAAFPPKGRPPAVSWGWVRAPQVARGARLRRPSEYLPPGAPDPVVLAVVPGAEGGGATPSLSKKKQKKQQNTASSLTLTAI